LLDHVLVTNEVVDEIIHIKQSFTIIKLDFEKAYYWVR